MLEFIILILIFCAAGLVIKVLLPSLLERYGKVHEKKVEEASKKLDNLFVQTQRKKLFLFFILAPLMLAGAGLLFFNNLLIALLGGVVGFALPNIFIRLWEQKRKYKFQAQLLDTLMILSGSLKAGLSLLQAMEVLTEDMPAPTSQEFGLVVKEIKMGMNLEEGLQRLGKRMPSPELTLMINSILVAGATGGDLTKVFSRLNTTIRNNRKLKENIKTLTLQGRMQGVIMSVLPFLFIWWVLTFNRQHFDIMLESETGRMLLFLAVILQIVGMFLIRKFSTIKI